MAVSRPAAISSAREIQRVSALIMGDIGVGKTTFLGTAKTDPRTSPMLLIDFEGGSSVLSDQEVDVAHIQNWEDFSSVYEYLEGGSHPYKSVGLDSLSEVYRYSLFTELDLEGSSKEQRGVRANMIELGDYNTAGVRVRRLIDHLKRLPLHFFATTLIKEKQVPFQGMMQVPELSGSIARQLPGIFEAVTLLVMGQIRDHDDGLHRVLFLQNYQQATVKVRVPQSRLESVPNYLIDPTMTQLMDVLLGSSEGPLTLAES